MAAGRPPSLLNVATTVPRPLDGPVGVAANEATVAVDHRRRRRLADADDFRAFASKLRCDETRVRSSRRGVDPRRRRTASRIAPGVNRCLLSSDARRQRHEARPRCEARRDSLSVEKGSYSRLLRQRTCPSCRGCRRSRRPSIARRPCRKTSGDVAKRRGYRRCVRNVSACSTGRQQQSTALQALSQAL